MYPHGFVAFGGGVMLGGLTLGRAGPTGPGAVLLVVLLISVVMCARQTRIQLARRRRADEDEDDR